MIVDKKIIIVSISVLFAFSFIAQDSTAQWTAGLPPTGSLEINSPYTNASNQILVFQYADVFATSEYNSASYMDSGKTYFDIDRLNNNPYGVPGNVFKILFSGNWLERYEYDCYTHYASSSVNVYEFSPCSPTLFWYMDDSDYAYDEGDSISIGTIGLEYVSPIEVLGGSEGWDLHDSPVSSNYYFFGDRYMHTTTTIPDGPAKSTIKHFVMSYIVARASCLYYISMQAGSLHHNLRLFAGTSYLVT